MIALPIAHYVSSTVLLVPYRWKNSLKEKFMQYYGYAGKILWVNLSTGKIEKEPLDIELATKFVGSCGVHHVLAYDLFKPGLDPFSPEAPILIGAGPLVGTLTPGAGQIEGTIKFPLPASSDNRYYIASGSSGSNNFGYMLKAAGFDHLIILGRAEKPVYLKIIDDNVETCDASNLWGKKDTFETTDELTGKFGRCGVITIGAAGENLNRFSFAWVDGKCTMGRNGFGAVMGSKNLKAIVVKGSKGIKIHDPKRFMKTVREIKASTKDNPFYKDHQQAGMHAGQKAWRESLNMGIWPKAKADVAFSMEQAKEMMSHNYGCSSCFLGCKSEFDIKEGRFAGEVTHKGAFLVFTWASQILDTDDIGIAAKLRDTANRAGLCDVAFRGLASVLTNLFEKGLISEANTDGFRVTRDYDSFAQLMDMVIHRKGTGDAFAEGWFAIGEKVGVDFSQYLSMVKGSTTIYDPRTAKLDPRIFSMAVNPRAAHHPECHWITSYPRMPIKAIRKEAANLGISKATLKRIFTRDDYNLGRLTAHVQDRGMVFDSIGTCVMYQMFRFPVNMVTLAELYSAATGIETTPAELKRAGERAFNLLKVLNAREGFSRQDDQFPALWFQPKPTADGEDWLMDYYHRRIIDREASEQILDDYYDERGWGIEKGIPTKEKLVSLGLGRYYDQRYQEMEKKIPIKAKV